MNEEMKIRLISWSILAFFTILFIINKEIKKKKKDE